MPSRELPRDLADALAAARRVERAAVTRPQLLEAIHATTGLVHRARAPKAGPASTWLQPSA